MAKKSVCEFDFERDRTTQQLCRMSGIVTNRFHDFTAKNGKFSRITEAEKIVRRLTFFS